MNTNSLSQKESKKLKKIRETKERQKAKKDLMKSPLNTERPDMSKYTSESDGDAPGEKLEEVSLDPIPGYEKVMEWYNGNSCEDSWHLMKKYPKAWKELLRITS